MRQRVNEANVGAGFQFEVIVGFHMRAAHQIDGARIGHDEARAGAQAMLDA